MNIHHRLLAYQQVVSLNALTLPTEGVARVAVRRVEVGATPRRVRPGRASGRLSRRLPS